MDLNQIIKKCKKGKLDAQKALYEAYSGTLYYIALRYVKDQDVAQDLLHDCFITIFDKIKTYRGEGSFEGWIKRIMVNTSLSYLRKLKKEKEHEEHIFLVETNDREDENLVNMDKVLRTLNRLPMGARTIFNLYYIEGYTHKEIAQELNISEGTSKSQLGRARELLKQELNKEGGNYAI